MGATVTVPVAAQSRLRLIALQDTPCSQGIGALIARAQVKSQFWLLSWEGAGKRLRFL